MANFWDLPKHVRERIYRLHLVKESPIDIEDFMASCEDDLGPYWNTKRAHRGMPKLLHVSKRTEREAAGIYFRENTFAWSTPWDSHQWKFRLWPRHIVLIRKIIIDGWVHPERFGKGYNADFRLLKSLKGLEELTLKVDERKALEEGLAHHPTIKWHSSLGCSPQLQLQVLHFCGVYGLRSLTNIPRLDFQPLTKEGRELHGDSGAIPGGVLDTLVRHDITRPLMSRPHDRKGAFRFLDLPPELRNKVYALLLIFPGVTYPKVDKPTSVTYQFPYLRGTEKDDIAVPHTALALLQANHQIHNEAAALFYQMNDLVFSYPAHLQDFAQSLEQDRLNSVSSLTLFHKNHNEGGISTMATTLKMLRRMRGLKKFHLLVDHHLIHNTWWSIADVRNRCVTRLQGILVLFTLRGISDIKVRDLNLEDRLHKLDKKETDQADSNTKLIRELVEMLKHFNHGLALAQTGDVQKNLYEDTRWFEDSEWPVLGNGLCSRLVGCLCETPVGEGEDEEGDSGSD